MIDTFHIIDPEAPAAENIGAVLAYREEVAHADALRA